MEEAYRHLTRSGLPLEALHNRTNTYAPFPLCHHRAAPYGQNMAFYKEQHAAALQIASFCPHGEMQNGLQRHPDPQMHRTEHTSAGASHPRLHTRPLRLTVDTQGPYIFLPCEIPRFAVSPSSPITILIQRIRHVITPIVQRAAFFSQTNSKNVIFAK